MPTSATASPWSLVCWTFWSKLLPEGGVPARAVVGDGAARRAARELVEGPVAGGVGGVVAAEPHPVDRQGGLDHAEAPADAVGEVGGPLRGGRAQGPRPGGIAEPEEGRGVGVGQVARGVAPGGADLQEAVRVERVRPRVRRDADVLVRDDQPGRASAAGLARSAPGPRAAGREGRPHLQGVATIPEGVGGESRLAELGERRLDLHVPVEIRAGDVGEGDRSFPAAPGLGGRGAGGERPRREDEGDDRHEEEGGDRRPVDGYHRETFLPGKERWMASA